RFERTAAFAHLTFGVHRRAGPREHREEPGRGTGEASMITVCHLSTSRSERVVWLLEELGLPYELEWYQREGTGAAPAVMREIHPIGKAPIIRDGELVLAESGAIVEYIVQRYGKGRLSVPPESHAYPQYLYWLHFAEGSLMTLMLIALVLSRVPEANDS